jgi:uridylate kinase
MAAPLPYKRVMLKVSGEALLGPEPYGLHQAALERIAGDVADAARHRVEIGVVIGGGNIVRGATIAATGIDRVTGDFMGMLATVMNGLALHAALERQGITARVISAIPLPTICEPYARELALRHFEKGRVCIFVAGTGNPFFTTDTTAALRAAEMRCDAIFKGTQVDGIYSADPKRVADARRYDRLTYADVLSRDLKVMDAAAIALARDNRIPVIVFSIHEPGAFAAILKGGGRYTVVEG